MAASEAVAVSGFLRRKKLTIEGIIAQNDAHVITALVELLMARSRDGASGEVRIIGGRWRGTRLPVTTTPGLRPTSDRVRETLFNLLQPVLPGARVLDVFAGSGALGLEALSRGAIEALLVEQDAAVVEALHGVIARLHAGSQAHVLRADAQTLLRMPLHGRFDVVFVDPPFDANLLESTLALLSPWLADHAWLYLERPLPGRSNDDPAVARGLSGLGLMLHREGRTREARYALYRRSLNAAATLGTPGLGADSVAVGASKA